MTKKLIELSISRGGVSWGGLHFGITGVEHLAFHKQKIWIINNIPCIFDYSYEYDQKTIIKDKNEKEIQKID